MAQAQTKEVSSVGTRAMSNVPAQARGRQLASSRRAVTGSAGPFGLMRRLTDDVDQLFGQLIGGMASGRGAPDAFNLIPAVDWMPALEIFERDGNLVVQADLPGVALDDITVEVADGVLTISGERREEREVDDGGFRRTERSYGRFSRSIALPEGARTEDIQASCHDGVLQITVPAPEGTSQRQTIEVKSARNST